MGRVASGPRSVDRHVPDAPWIQQGRFHDAVTTLLGLLHGSFRLPQGVDAIEPMDLGSIEKAVARE